MLNFKNKKVTVMGLGLNENGSGISATRFLVERGAKVTVTDLKTREQLKDQIRRLGKMAKKIKLVLGEHREENFRNIDLLVKNPDVRNTSKYLQIAQTNKIPIETDISVFFQLIDKKRIIGITGTRGKSTTASLIYEIIKLADRNAVLGGNITNSPLAQMAEVKRGGSIVLELSSWMLESLEPHKISPHLSVFTNIYPDHLNTYKDIAEYAAAKENIFRWQAKNDLTILSRDNGWTRKMGARVRGKRFWFSKKYFAEENGAYLKGKNIYFRLDGQETKILKINDIKIPGEHNLENVLAAVGATMAWGVKPEHVRRGVKSFKGISDRLELLREIKGIKYYNDTTSTTPEATMAALRALSSKVKTENSKEKNIILVAGGSDKGLDFDKLVQEIKKTTKVAVLLRGSGSERLAKEFLAFSFQFSVVDSMADAVGVARSFAKEGDIILLSPACASFGMFNNEFDRGGQYRKIVSKLK